MLFLWVSESPKNHQNLSNCLELKIGNIQKVLIWLSYLKQMNQITNVEVEILKMLPSDFKFKVCNLVCLFGNMTILSEPSDYFLTFPACFSIPIIFPNLNLNFLHMRNLEEQAKKAFCYQKLFWPFTVWINCSSNLNKFANSWPSASNFKSFFLITRALFSYSRSEQFW